MKKIKLKKTTQFIISASFLSGVLITIPGCMTSSDLFKVNLITDKDANLGSNYLIVFEQPSSLDQMVDATYDSISKNILENTDQFILIHPQRGGQTLEYKSKDEPASMYFILDNLPDGSNWKYFVPSPAGSEWDCDVKKDGMITCQES